MMRRLLAAGRFGARMTVPEHLTIANETERMLDAVDPASGVHWTFFYFPDLHFVLDDDAADAGTLRAGLEQHARLMFDTFFAEHPPEGAGPFAMDRPRTADPDWSPLVEATPVQLGATPALRVLHRMAYQPGREVMLGHLLVPLAGGLFEARAIAHDEVTGMRESVIMVKQGRDAHPGQADFDDPALDDTFPQHCLSRVRAALRWLEHDSGLTCDAPAPRRAHGETVLAAQGCALVAPPRFVHRPGGGSEACFVRVAFCGTDGLEHFIVTCAEAELGRLDAAALSAKALDAVRATYREAGVKDIEVRRETDEVFVAEGLGHEGRLRAVFHWFLDEGQRPWHLAISSLAAAPWQARAQELAAARQSFRLTSPPPPARPKRWWRRS